VKRQIHAHGLERFVAFASVSYEHMPSLYASSDIVLYPTAGEEPYGLVPLEAMSCGRLVVISKSGGMAETVQDGITGYVCHSGDIDGMVRAVSRLLDDPDSRRVMGHAGRRLVRTQLTFDQCAAALLHAYEGSVSERTRRSGLTRSTGTTGTSAGTSSMQKDA
jgi:glycosyltransferase involved in cell wall biosynthesis